MLCSATEPCVRPGLMNVLVDVECLPAAETRIFDVYRADNVDVSDKCDRGINLSCGRL